MKQDVVVGYVRGERVDGHYFESMLRLVMTERRILEVHGVVSGPAVALMRNKVCARMLYHTRAEWLLFVDTDMSFDVDLLARLVSSAHPVLRPVVGGLCFSADTFGGQIKPTLYTGDGPDDIMWDYPADTLVKVHATGAACLLIHRSTLDQLAARYTPMPWFADELHDGRQVSEDRTFCRRLKETGIPLWVHTGIKLGHSKVHAVGEAHYRAARALVSAGSEESDR